MSFKIIAMNNSKKLVSLSDLPQPISIKDVHQGVAGLLRVAQERITQKVQGIKNGNNEKIAINQAGAIAVECGAGVLLEIKNADTGTKIKFKNISEVFKYLLAEDNNSPEKINDMLLVARFANATWKAGQPLRGLQRMQKSNYIPASMLSTEELEKDFVQIKAATKCLYEEMLARAGGEEALNKLSAENQLEILKEMMQDLGFAKKIGEHLNNQYYLGIGATPPQFLDDVPGPGKVNQMIEDEAVRVYLQFELDKALSTLKEVTPDDLRQLQWLGNRVIEGHMGQYRTDGIRPYFVHQIHLLRVMHEFFGVHSPLLAKILLLHDTREDRPDAYKDIKVEIEKMAAETEPTADNIQFGKIRLGVRILTNDYDDPEMVQYLARLSDPRIAFNKDAVDYKSDKPVGYYVNYTDNDITLFQLAKVIDIVGNGVDSQSTTPDFILKTRAKIDKYRAGFIDNSTYLDQGYKGKFNLFYRLFVKGLAGT
ncbi:MAG: hypothetical protein PHF25_01560 [Candidatus Margulisbacteria bacterium]|nr:hypothetical protein [Candidatus Margulisiibacteriota bacterium]